MTPTAIILGFSLSAVLVVAAGTALARSGDVIAARTKLGGLWIGSILVAAATSLPELTTDIAAVRLGAPDLAVGDLFGSGMANMLILAVITLMPVGSELFRKATLDHALYAALAILLTCIAGALLVMRPEASFLRVGPGSLLIVAIYLAGTRAIFRHTATARQAGTTIETAALDQAADHAPRDDAVAATVPTLRGAALRFAAAALVILVAAPFFARSAAALAVLTGLGTTFVGTWLVGLSTSLPELVTSLAAVRMRSYDLAVGNLFGSNALNMSILIALDLAHGGPVLSVASEVHLVSALAGVALMSTGLAALVFRATRRFSMLEPSGATMAVIYVLGLALVYLQSTR
jgi:cation:H+ antiporter